MFGGWCIADTTNGNVNHHKIVLCSFHGVAIKSVMVSGGKSLCVNTYLLRIRDWKICSVPKETNVLHYVDGDGNVVVSRGCHRQLPEIQFAFRRTYAEVGLVLKYDHVIFGRKTHSQFPNNTRKQSGTNNLTICVFLTRSEGQTAYAQKQG